MLVYFHLELAIIEIVPLREAMPNLIQIASFPSKIKFCLPMMKFVQKRETKSTGAGSKREILLYYEGTAWREKVFPGRT
jgi:hypothetical protein